MNWCELDKYASEAYMAIHGESEEKNLGDITKVDETKLKPFNMICGGSPCQDFSVAGKQAGSKWKCNDCGEEYNPLIVHYSKRHMCPKCNSKNIDKTRSSLLVEWLRVLRAVKPNWGIYENVKNIVGKKFKETFDMFLNELHEYGYNTHFKVLNAKDYGIPQNRERAYLFIVKQELDNGMFQFPEPFELQLRLKDVLNEVVDKKFYLSNEQTKHLTKNSNWGFGLNEAELNEVIRVGNCNPSGKGQNGTVIDSYGVARTVTVEKGEGQKILVRENKLSADIHVIGRINSSQDGVVVDPGGIAPTHTAGHGNMPKIVQVCQIYPNSGNPQAGRIYDSDGISPSLDTCTGGNRMPKIIETTYRIRKLLPLECYRLMGFSDEDFFSAMCGSRHVAKEILQMHGHDCLEVMKTAETKQKISNTQLYKQAGNSIVVDVLYYIYLEIYKAMPYLFDNLKLGSFFSGIGAFEVALDRFYETVRKN